MQILSLHFNAFHLGELTYDNNCYTFKLDEESTKMLIKAGVNVAIFETNKKEIITKELPLAFKHFLPTKVDEFVLAQIGILKTDSDFEKLIKVSKLNLSKNKFWLELKKD
ncbi:MAG: hypothetical protein PHC46_02020 [Clostridia bacterium]|nr:hypothetical protein [Clostridia bacterium]